jgi:hypothetical protein
MGHVYLFQDTSTGHYKIGATKDDDVQVRLNKLRTGNPHLELSHNFETADPFPLETKLKNTFAEKRTKREFYALSDADLFDVEQIANEYEGTWVPLKDRVNGLKKQWDNGEMLQQEESHRQHVADWQQAKGKFYRAKLELEQAGDQVRIDIGPAKGIIGLVTWKAFQKLWLNNARLKEEQPELYAQYAEPKVQRSLHALE